MGRLVRYSSKLDSILNIPIIQQNKFCLDIDDRKNLRCAQKPQVTGDRRQEIKAIGDRIQDTGYRIKQISTYTTKW